MGFFERMAGKSELVVQERMLTQLSTAVAVLGRDIKFGPAKFVCPFAQEEHNGFFVAGNARAAGVFRCKGSWWRKPATREEKVGLEAGREKAMYMNLTDPENLGPISQPVEPLTVEVIASVL